MRREVWLKLDPGQAQIDKSLIFGRQSQNYQGPDKQLHSKVLSFHFHSNVPLCFSIVLKLQTGVAQTFPMAHGNKYRNKLHTLLCQQRVAARKQNTIKTTNKQDGLARISIRQLRFSMAVQRPKKNVSQRTCTQRSQYLIITHCTDHYLQFAPASASSRGLFPASANVYA
jgi:hypothetical protein